MFQVRGGFWAFIVLVVVSLAGALETNSLVYYRILFLSLGVIILSLILAIISLNGISITRSARITRHLVGQVFEERFLLHNRSIIGKIWLEIRDGSALMGESGSRVLSGVKPRDHRSYIAYSLLNRRGLIPLGPTRISGGDPLGMFKKSVEVDAEDELLVFPFFTSLKSFPLQTGLLPGGNTRRKKSYDVTPFAAGIREYVPSDSLHRIHWPSTAKRGKLMVKEFDQDPQSDVWIFLDSNSSVHVRGKEEISESRIDRFWIFHEQKTTHILPETYEYAVSMAASVASYALDNNYAVGIATAGQVSTILPAERGSRQLIKVLELLASIRDEGSQPLSALVETQLPYFQKGSTVVLITAGNDLKTIHVCVEEILLRRMNPVVVLVDANSFGVNRNYGPVILEMRKKNIPLKVLNCGDDLSKF